MLITRVPKCVFKPNNDNQDFQITDLLQLSHKENESRIQCLRIMRHFGAWKKFQRRHEDPALVFYTKIQGALLKRQVQDAIFLYRLVKQDRKRAFQNYMDRLPARTGVYGAAQ